MTRQIAKIGTIERISAFQRRAALLAQFMMVSCGARTTLESENGEKQECGIKADFQSSSPEFHFETDLSFSLETKISLVSGRMFKGDPEDIRHQDAVCEGAVLRLAHSVDARWALCNLDIVSIYPTCDGTGYYPEMIDYQAGINTDVPIRWLRDGGENARFGEQNDFSNIAQRRSGLVPFHDQPVTYVSSFGDGGTHEAKKGGANVFCNGSVVTTEIRIGREIGRTVLPEAHDVIFDVGVPGGIVFNPRIEDVVCFAAVEKHPLNLDDHPEFYHLYYFAHNRPVLSEVARGNINILIQDCR